MQDDTALLLLGQCFETGFGVHQNLRTAIEYYKQAARAGNTQAKSLLALPNGTGSKGEHIFVWVIRFCAFVSDGSACDKLLMSQNNSDNIFRMSHYFLFRLPLLFSRRCCVALHPFSSVFLFSRLSTPAAALVSGQSCHSLHRSPCYPSSPASLLEHREPVCPPNTVLHASSPASPQHWGRNVPVDCRDRIVIVIKLEKFICKNR